MPAAPIPPDEAERLAALSFLGFDPAAERPLPVGAFDRAARLVRAIFAGADAAVTLIGADEQVVAADGCAETGPCARGPSDAALCAHTILADAVLWCEDASRDPRFSDSPLVTSRHGVRFYAGAPIRAGGRRIGALCAFAPGPRAYDAALSAQLAEIAAMVGDALELRLSHDALMAAETARREAQRERDTVLEVPVALVFLDRDMRIRRYSRQWLVDYLGAEAANPAGRDLRQVLGGLEVFQPMFDRVLAGEVVCGDTPYPDPAGAIRHKRYEARPWRAADGRIAGLSITSLDVTELVEAHDLAKRSEERLELALDISSTLVWELDADTGGLLAYGAVDRIFGGAPDRAALAADPFLAVYEADRPAVREAWRRHVEEGAPYAVQYRVARLDGAEMWVAATSKVRPAADGRPARVIGVMCDVNDLVRARLEAEHSETRLQLALDISESVVWEIEPARGLVVSGAVERIFGGAPDLAAWNGDLMMGVHPDDREAARAAWRRHVREGAPYAQEYRIARLDGRETWVAASAELRPSGEGEPPRIIGVVHDITAIKQAEIAGQRAVGAAQAASRAKGEFLANMSHELRTPLNGVLGVAGALSRTGLNADQGEMVGLIETSARSLERLLSDVLDLAKIESQAFSLDAEPVDVGGLVRGIGTLFQWRARDKGLSFDCRVADALSSPRAVDETRLRQILTNLLSNAIKFTERGRVSLSARLEGADVVFEVEDTGIGFDAEAKARLFERFEQADGSITRRYGGTGLGLAISRSLAERMGGGLDARSTPGSGSTFTLRLPLAPAEARRVAAPAAPAAARSTRARVLLAEDHPVNRRVVELILAGAEVDLTSVVNGAEALEALAGQDFDLVLMDVQMPVLDGLSATRELRAREAAAGARRTPVLALTANAGAEQAAA
ncbi:MAG: PAS domain-containing protein, partial [Caulobacteraceae bacterium]|nr:PAS domain-containing protein [Caulobacter sp.]